MGDGGGSVAGGAIDTAGGIAAGAGGAGTLGEDGVSIVAGLDASPTPQTKSGRRLRQWIR